MLTGDGRRVDRHLRRPYRWIRARMAERIPGTPGGYPVWAWYRPKPDLRHVAYLPAGTPGVRVEFLAPAAPVAHSAMRPARGAESRYPGDPVVGTGG